MSKNFKEGDKVKWIEPMTLVPHPEGTLKDRKGNVLPVFRDKEFNGRIISGSGDKYTVRPDWAERYKDAICGERYYDRNIEATRLSLV
tara:strand:- start:172 stop:435 length:264 start_codon:yes stop_codon:yes gene_type:complete